MLTPKLNKEGLSQVWSKILENFASKTLVSGKADKADTYTKGEVDSAIRNAVAGVYAFKGSVNFAELPAEGMKAGDTYNVKDKFTTTEGFAEGAGHKYPAGTNVSYTESGWDCLAGIYDFTDFVMKTDIVDITAEEIDAICVMPPA